MKKAKDTWVLDPAPEDRSQAFIAPHYDLFIDGRFQKSSKGSRFKSINPADESILSEITESTSADIDKAMQAARKAY
ncbi:MAG: aldehyde dehydrogenase family protein, partial [Bacteroidetes bacterium]|nr:aldehyde dehydrogenase family protein [Bacteroidota bacterium]